MFNKWDQPEAADRLDLVFEDRFKEYGAYEVRSKYRMSKVIATAIACGFIFLAASAPLAMQIWGKKKNGGSKTVRVQAVTLDDLDEPKEEKKEIEPPKLEKIQEVASQQYTVPEIDPNTTEEAELPPVNQINNPGATTKVGSNEYFPTDNGDEAFIEYIKNNFEYPPRCQEEGINGYVKLRFVVDGSGAISLISPVEETKSCPEFTQEAIRVLKKSPRWIPGMVGGKYVKSWREIPIRLNLEN